MSKPRPPRQADVARLASVSPAVVSLVINSKTDGKVRISEATRLRVLEAVETLGYSPNAFARSLVTNRSDSVGVVVRHLGSPLFGGILWGIESTLEACGLQLMVSSGHGAAASEQRAVEFLQQRRCDALIVHIEEAPDEMVRTWARHTPLVVIGRRIDGVASVYLDEEAGGFAATTHLLEHGHRHIVHISGDLTRRAGRERLAGYRRALEAAGGYDPRYVIEGGFVEEGGRAAVESLLGQSLAFSAVFAGNDHMAVGALTALQEAGLSVPDDVSLVGFDDIRLTSYLRPPLTTVHYPALELGQAAAELVLGALQGHTGQGHAEPIEASKHLTPQLIRRHSVSTLESDVKSTLTSRLKSKSTPEVLG